MVISKKEKKNKKHAVLMVDEGVVTPMDNTASVTTFR